MFPKKIYLYISKEFLRFYIVTLLTFLTIFVLVDYIEKSPRYFTKYDVDFPTILKYFLYLIPERVLLFSPLAVLLSVLITLILLGRNLEIIAMRACGVSLLSISLPFIINTTFIFILNIGIVNWVIPQSALAFQLLERIQIKQKKTGRIFSDKNWIRYENKFYRIKKLSKKNTILRGLTIFEFRDDFTLAKRTNIAKVKWSAKRKMWRAYNSKVYLFNRDSDLTNVISQKKSYIQLAGEPSDFSFEEKKPEQMSYSELSDFIDQSVKEGADATELWVELHLKIAYPFINIIMCLLGIPFALTKERSSNIAMGIVITLSIGILYFILLSFMRSLGRANEIPPFMGAWSANILFLVIGIFLLRRVQN